MLLAMPLTVLMVIIFGQFQETRWLAVLMSTNPIPPKPEEPQPVASEAANSSAAPNSSDSPD